MLASILKQSKSININTAINYVAIVYAFCLPISRAGISVGTALLFILWLVEGDFREKFSFLSRNKMIISVFAFIMFSAFSLLWSSDPALGSNALRKYWYLLPLLVFATSIRKEYLSKILSAFLFGMLISEIISFGVFFEWWTFKNATPLNPTPFMHHIQYSMFLAITALLLLNRYFFESSHKWKIFYFIYFLTVTTNLFINGGRTGQLAFVISIVVLGFYNIKNKVKAFFIMFLLSMLIMVTAYNFSQVFKVRLDKGIHEVSRLLTDDKNKYSGSLGYRFAVWHEAIVTIIPEHPIVGVGLGDEMHVIEDNIEKNNYDGVYKNALRGMIKYNYHNAYIQYTVQLGIIGLFLYLLIFYNIFRLEILDKELSNTRYMFILVFCISSLFDVAFTVQFPLALFALFVGLFIGVSHIDKKVFSFRA